MPVRSWIALLLLSNYLLVVGIGCMSRPEDQREFVMIQTSQEGQYYQECRYLRMDGLEAFLTEALASRYQNPPETPKHHLVSVVIGVDAHDLVHLILPLPLPVYRVVAISFVRHQTAPSGGINRAVYPPPRVG